MITDEVIADEDDLKLVRECQAWFLDETVKDEKRKRRIKKFIIAFLNSCPRAPVTCLQPILKIKQTKAALLFL